MEVVEQQRQPRADHDRHSSQRVRAAGRHRQRHEGDARDLDDPPGSAVEEVAEVRGQRDERAVGEQPADGPPRHRRDRDEGDGHAADQLQTSGCESPTEQRDHMTTEAPRIALAQEIIDHAQHPEAHGNEEHERPRAAQSVGRPCAGSSGDGPPRLDAERRHRHGDSRGVDDLTSAPVRPHGDRRGERGTQ